MRKKVATVKPEHNEIKAEIVYTEIYLFIKSMPIKYFVYIVIIEVQMVFLLNLSVLQ